MPNLEDFRPQEAAWRALTAEELPHALLITGQPGCGKRTLAGLIAARLLCEADSGEKPCGVCRACLQLREGNHPDLTLVRPGEPIAPSEDKGKKSIPVNDIRELSRIVSRHAYEGARRAVIIEQAEAMGPAAQNALLKTLEEPPAYGMILLLADNRNRFLPTVLSRVATLRCEEESGGEEKESSGSARLIRLLRRLQTADAAELAKAASELKSDGVSAEETFELLTYLWRDELIVKAGGKTRLRFAEAADMLEDWGNALSWADEDRVFAAIQEGKAKLKANGNPDVALEVFLLELRELLRKA
jgi:DNA polymerase-3 subunit delta'